MTINQITDNSYANTKLRAKLNEIITEVNAGASANYAGDGVHPSTAGAGLLAVTMADVIGTYYA